MPDRECDESSIPVGDDAKDESTGSAAGISTNRDRDFSSKQGWVDILCLFVWTRRDSVTRVAKKNLKVSVQETKVSYFEFRINFRLTLSKITVIRYE